MDNTNQTAGSFAGVSARLLAIESSLRGITGTSPGDAAGSEVLNRALTDLASIRADLEGGASGHGTGAEGSSGASQKPADTSPASSDAALNASVDQERIKRAVSELKSGEFDMQG